MYGVQYGDPPVARERRPIDHHSMPATTSRILLELSDEQDTLTGRLIALEPTEADAAAAGGREAQTFSGWVGLLSALERMLPSAAAQQGDQTD